MADAPLLRFYGLEASVKTRVRGKNYCIYSLLSLCGKSLQKMLNIYYIIHSFATDLSQFPKNEAFSRYSNFNKRVTMHDVIVSRF